VPGPRDQLLEEHDPRPERALGLVAGALVGVGEFVGGGDLADAAAAAAGRRLEHQRVADALGRGEGILEAVDPAPAPRGDGHPDLLGDELAADLVAQPSHRLAGRPDERDAQRGHEVGERGVLGDEAPADPHGVRARLGQHAGQQVVVQVRPLRRRPERVRLVGLTREHGRALGVRVERDRGDRGGVRMFGVQVSYGVDEPHGGLSAVDDRDALEHEPTPVRPGGAPSLGENHPPNSRASVERNGVLGRQSTRRYRPADECRARGPRTAADPPQRGRGTTWGGRVGL